MILVFRVDGLVEGEADGDVDGLVDGDVDGLVDGDVDGLVGGLVVPPVQATPLRENAVGTGFEPVHEPLKPNDAVPPVPIEPFQAALRTVTAEPDWVTVPLQSWVMVCPLGNVKVRDQELTGSPRLVTSTAAPKPPGHWLETVYLTEQPAAASALVAVANRKPTRTEQALARTASLRRCMGICLR
jgi:hypothetical protein